MLLQYFQFGEQPSGSTPDPRFLFRGGSHREALASLYTGFYGNRGFTLLIAEPGMGKTTLLFDFLDHIRSQAKTAFLFATPCGPDDISCMILQGLGVTPAATVAQRHLQMSAVLNTEAQAGRKVVVVIDEAQNLGVESLEAVRQLSNFETAQTKLLQIVLAGQPLAADRIATPELDQLRQRISTICQLKRFSCAESVEYIQHRLNVAGYAGPVLFSESALRLIAESSGGVPRVIHTLCFNSLCLCRARNVRQVDQEAVAEAISDLRLPTTRAMPTISPTPLNRSEEIAPPDVPAFIGVNSSSGNFLHFISAALLATCLAVLVIAWWITPTSRNLSLAPVLAHGWNKTISMPMAPPVERGSITSPRGLQHDLATEPMSDDASKVANVVVAPGDTLAGIAIVKLGSYDGFVRHQILALNPYLQNPDHIEIGRTLRLPGRAAIEPYSSDKEHQ
jgi:type II secretory pathway predicted ATPase ExeA